MNKYQLQCRIRFYKNKIQNLHKKIVNQLRHWGMVNKPEVKINPKPRLPNKS